MKSHPLLLIWLCCLLASCGHRAVSTVTADDVGDTATLLYAKGFRIVNHTDYKCVEVLDPWHQGVVLYAYYLVRDSNVVTPDATHTLRVPITRMAISSCTHVGFMETLNALHNVSGMCMPHIVYNDSIRQATAGGKIADLGDAFNVNMERLLTSHPQAFMLSSYSQQDENTRRLMMAGIPLIFNNEWTETSLLGRAEWLKFVAAFLGKENEADSIFACIERDYNEALQLTHGVSTCPSVMVGGNFKGTWYVSGGNSYMGKLLADAGGDYYYKNDTNTGSLPLNFEMVLAQFGQSDVWVNAPAATMVELLAMDKRHGLFHAVKAGRVYAFKARYNARTSANDFWESGVTHPNLVLKDMIWALHPDLLQDYTPTYILKLQ